MAAPGLSQTGWNVPQVVPTFQRARGQMQIESQSTVCRTNWTTVYLPAAGTFYCLLVFSLELMLKPRTAGPNSIDEMTAILQDTAMVVNRLR
jgi:hypothetical protein